MIVLDTNVISEMMRRQPDAAVMAWLGEQPMAGVFTTSLTQAEIFYGLALLPEGRRRDELMAAARPIFETDLAGRVLPFDTDAADAYPAIAASRRQAGGRSVRSTPRSPPSSVRAAPGWQPATRPTSSTAASRSSIRGRGRRAFHNRLWLHDCPNP